MSLVVSMGWRYWETTTKMIADWKLISSCFCWINFHDYQGRQTTKWNFFPSRKREVFMLFSWIYIRLDLFVTLWLKVKSIKLLGIADWYNPWFSWERNSLVTLSQNFVILFDCWAQLFLLKEVIKAQFFRLPIRKCILFYFPDSR